MSTLVGAATPATQQAQPAWALTRPVCLRNLTYWDSGSTSGEICKRLSPDSLTLSFKSEGSVLPQEPELLGLGEHIRGDLCMPLTKNPHLELQV